jgi:phycobilisome rod-core linker protein
MPRYGADYRTQLEGMGYFKPITPQYRWEWQKPPYPKVARIAGLIITVTGAVVVGGVTIAIALAAWGLITL